MKDIPELENYIGTDESGKGDFFGPLVIAGVLVNPDSLKKLEDLNILESKRISDNRAITLSEDIQNTTQTSLVIIGPEKYNELYEKIRNLNKLLGWGHARVIENILQEAECSSAISDQFGDERNIASALQKKGKLIELYQTPRAERYLGVAAASVLARASFLKYLYKLRSEYGIDFHKGASNIVDERGCDFVKKHGADKLKCVAKLHFKNFKRITA